MSSGLVTNRLVELRGAMVLPIRRVGLCGLGQIYGGRRGGTGTDARL